MGEQQTICPSARQWENAQTQALLLERPRVRPLEGVGDNRVCLKGGDQSGVRHVPPLLRNIGETLALLYDFSRGRMHPFDGKWVNNLAFVRSAVLKNPFRGDSYNEQKELAECSGDVSKIKYIFNILPYQPHLMAFTPDPVAINFPILVEGFMDITNMHLP